MPEPAAIREPILAEPETAPRWHHGALIVIALFGIVRGLFWSVSYPLPWGDEAAHFSYIQSLATGQGVPVTGKSYMTSDTMTLLKNNRAGEWQTFPAPPTSDPRWGFDREQYEGYQTPLYYIAMVPFYWIGRPFGLTGIMYAIRLATLLITLSAIPLLYALGKEIFPRRQMVWLVAPALLITIQMFNAYAVVGNDGIMVALGALCPLALLRSRRGLTLRRAAMFGAATGLCALGKGTAMGIFPLLSLGLIGLYFATGRRTRQFMAWLATAGGVMLLLLLPWIAFNVHAYQAISGGKQAATLVEPIIGRTPVNLSGVHRMWTTATSWLFVAQDAAARTSHYRRWWAMAGIGTTAAGIVGAAFRRSLRDLMIAGWLSMSLPLGLLTIILVTFSQSGAGAGVVGRHLGVLLPVLCLTMASGGAALLGPRLGATVLVILLVLFSWMEIASDHAWVRSVYTKGIIGNSAPVIDQSYTDGLTTSTTTLMVTAPCPVTNLSFSFPRPPMDISVNGRATLMLGTSGLWSTYRLGVPTGGVLTVNFSAPTPVYIDGQRSDSAIKVVGSSGETAVARVYCVVANPSSFRFDQTFRPQHPFGLTLRMLLDWPIAQGVLGVTVAAVVLVRLAAAVKDGW